tara:strand:+ start:685 stop:1611 length:927 start_codon:yes stop_codon:yes gene_type:complete
MTKTTIVIDYKPKSQEEEAPCAKVKIWDMFKYGMTTICLIYATIFAYLYFNQRNIVFLPSKGLLTPQAYDLDIAQDITLTTDDKLLLTAWHIKADEDQKTILYFHGNAGHIGNRSEKFKTFHRRGFGIFAVSYRGFGNSQGKPTEQGLYTDARTAMNYLLNELNLKPSDIVIYGESLGTGVAVQMATEYHTHALILEAPYTSIVNVAKHRYPYLPISLALKDRFESIDKIGSVASPIFIMHGHKDRIIPISNGMALLEAAKAPKEGKFFDNFGHLNFDFDVLADNTRNFVDRAGTMLVTETVKTNAQN